jgi:molybdopterin-guanine dinucleotide biosynthesis protein A
VEKFTYGNPKFQLPFDRRALISHIVESFAKEGPWSRISARYEFVRNETPYQGPAAARYDVLKAVKNEICFFARRF